MGAKTYSTHQTTGPVLITSGHSAKRHFDSNRIARELSKASRRCFLRSSAKASPRHDNPARRVVMPLSETPRVSGNSQKLQSCFLKSQSYVQKVAYSASLRTLLHSQQRRTHDAVNNQGTKHNALLYTTLLRSTIQGNNALKQAHSTT